MKSTLDQTYSLVSSTFGNGKAYRIAIGFLVSFVLLVSCCKPIMAQQEAATSAPVLDPFKLKPDDLGAMTNYVNQLTGEVSFPINLVSIPGPGGLGISVTFNYNSAGVENLINTWNQDAPTSVLGLGWTMNLPQITVDNKQTGTREDDEFYLVDGGSSTRLVCVAVSPGVRNYRTGTFTNWIIEYTEATEKWIVTKDDGTRFIYGDTQGTANSVQWVPRWGNWLGNSMASGFQLQAFIWNLREVRSIWGDRVTYSYTTGNITTGSGTLATEYSLLYKINDSWGHEVEFTMGSKGTSEFQNKSGWILNRPEKFYISKIMVRTNGALDNEYQFAYSTNELGTDQFTKRLLKSIKKVAPSGTIGAITSFEYASALQNNRGALNKIILPAGGSISFSYSSTGYYEKLATITETAPAGYAEPDVYIADDYAVVTWRQLGSGGTHIMDPMYMTASVLDWKGKWRKTNLGGVGPDKFVDNAKADSRVALGKDFFGIMTPYYGTTNHTLHLYHRTNGPSGEWAHTSETLDMGSGYHGERVKLFAGNNFLCASSNNGKLFRFVWNGNYWMRSDVAETAGERWTTATNNYILSHDPSPSNDIIKIYYLDQLMNWQTRTQTVTGFNSDMVNDPGEGTNWYSSNSSAFVMANESSEMILQWDENYNNISKVDMGWVYHDFSRIYFDGTTLGLTAPAGCGSPCFPSSFTRAARRAGNSWIDSGQKVSGYGFSEASAAGVTGFGQAAFGPDLMLWNSNNTWSYTFTFKYQVFDAVNSQWLSEVVTQSNQDNPNVNVGPDFFTIGRQIYFLKSTGYTLNTGYTIDPGHSLMVENTDVYPSSRKFITAENYIYWQRNGATEGVEWSGGYYRVRNTTSNVYSYLVGSSIYALCFGLHPNDNFRDVTTLDFRHVAMGAWDYDHPVILVQLDDGVAQQSVSFDYANPAYGPNESSVLYNKVTVVPGSTVPSNRPYGYSETYFYNSLNASEVSAPFLPAMPFGNGHAYHSLLTGQPYRTAVFKYNSLDTVSTTYNIMNMSLDYYIGPSGYFYMKTLRPYKTITKQDGKNEVVEFAFNPGGKRELTQKKFATQYASGLWDQKYEELTYGWQKYSSMETLNMLTQTVLTKQGVTGGSVTDASAVRWKQWTCSGAYCAASTIPAPVDRYAWRGTGSAAFSTWDVGTETPTGDWKYGSKVTVRDPFIGLEVELNGRGNTKSSIVLDIQKRPIASATNAVLADIAYTGLEDGTTGLWSSSDGVVTTSTGRTGKKFLALGTNGLTRTGLTSSTQYKLTFWVKTSGGSVQIDGVGTVSLGTLNTWTLFQYTVTGLTTVGLRRSGATEVQVDDIRLHPVNAMMSTKTYHDSFGVDSETDANNRPTFTEFDEFGRPRIIRDQDKNIVKHTFTNIKN